MKNGIGLTRGAVVLVPHNPKWRLLYEKEAASFQEILGTDVCIEHIGSTSIPTISAKPLIDVLVGIPRMRDVRTYIKRLEEHGYSWRPKFGRIDRHVVLAKGNERSRTHYIHIMRYNGSLWKDRIYFRDYLISHPTVAKEYESLKRKLERQYAQDRPTYTALKSDFVSKILNKSK